MKKILTLHEQKNIKNQIKEASDIFDNIKAIDIDYNQENLLVFYLNIQNRLLGCEVLFKGSMDSCILDPKIIFKKSLLNNAPNIIVAHNHSSEDLTPSEEDLGIAKTLKKIGELLGIEVLDNIIFNQEEYYSLNDEKI